MRTNTTGYILLSQGEYSDYQNRAFRVLKPFSFANTAVAFKAQWTTASKWRTEPCPDQYIAWLFAQGFIEDAPEIQEVHIGGFDFDDVLDEDLAQTVFHPRAFVQGEENGPHDPLATDQ